MSAPQSETFQTLQRSRKSAKSNLTPLSGAPDGRFVRHNLGPYFSRTKAIRICQRLGGRLPYRRELYSGVSPHGRLMINGGVPLSMNMWTPVLDGDPDDDNDAVGWVQVGDGCFLNAAPGQNHLEAFDKCPHWGAQVYAAWKDFVWCIMPESPCQDESKYDIEEMKGKKSAQAVTFKLEQDGWANQDNFKQVLRQKFETQKADTDVEVAAQQVAKDIFHLAGAVALGVADFDLTVLQNKLQVLLKQHSESDKVSDWIVNEASMALLVVDVDKRFKQQAASCCWGRASSNEIKAVGEIVCILASDKAAFQELQATLNASGVAVLKDLQETSKSHYS